MTIFNMHATVAFSDHSVRERTNNTNNKKKIMTKRQTKLSAFNDVNK